MKKRELLEETNFWLSYICEKSEVEENYAHNQLQNMQGRFKDYLCALKCEVKENYMILSDYINDGGDYSNDNLNTFRSCQQQHNVSNSVQKRLFNKICLFEFIYSYIYPVTRDNSKTSIRQFVSMARSLCAKDIQYDHATAMLSALSALKKLKKKLKYDKLNNIFSIIKNNNIERSRYILESETIHKQIIEEEDSLTLVNSSLTEHNNYLDNSNDLTKNILSCISNVYSLGFKTFERRKNAFEDLLNSIRSCNRDIEPHKKENFYKVFPSEYFSVDEVGYVVLNNNYMPKNFFDIVYLIINNCVRKRSDAGRFSRWRHKNQYGKVAEALVDIINSKKNELRLNISRITENSVRTNYHTVLDTLSIYGVLHSSAFSRLRDLENIRTRGLNEITPVINIKEEIKAQIDDIDENNRKCFDNIGSALAGMIECGDKLKIFPDEKKESYQTRNNDRVQLTGNADADKKTILIRITSLNKIPELISLQKWLNSTYLGNNCPFSRYCTWKDGRVTRCRHTLKNLEEAISIKLLYLLLNRNRNYENTRVFINNHFFIGVKRSIICNNNNLQISKNKLNDTAENYLVHISKGQYPEAENFLQKKYKQKTGSDLPKLSSMFVKRQLT
jgi:hypothetical protein